MRHFRQQDTTCTTEISLALRARSNNSFSGVQQALWNAFNASTNAMTQTGTQLILFFVEYQEKFA